MSAIANQKFNHLYLQGYRPLQNHLKKLLWRPHPGRHRSLRILPCTMPPDSRKQLKKLMLCPNSWSSVPTLIIIKEKMGEWQNNNVAIYKLAAILPSDLIWETPKDKFSCSFVNATMYPHPAQQ
jgi:hypothetical protein